MNECQTPLEVLAERIDQIEKRIYERFEAERIVRDSIALALTAKLDGMNEFRNQIKDERRTYVTWPSLLGVATIAVGAAVALVQMLHR